MKVEILYHSYQIGYKIFFTNSKGEMTFCYRSDPCFFLDKKQQESLANGYSVFTVSKSKIKELEKLKIKQLK
jgi:hypothetical protein